MLPRTLLSAVLVVVAAPAALAQPAGDVATETTDAAPEATAEPPLVLGYGAMPGGLFTASAVGLPAGQVGAMSLAAFGFRDDLLEDGHRYVRGSGSLAVAYAPIPLLTVGLTIDGRYDRHSGAPADGEDGYVGDPRLLVRLAKSFGDITLGAQLGVWLPGKDAPSVAFSATTVDLRVLGDVALGPATLSVNAGFRLDRSAESIENPGALSQGDQVSLGVSEFNAVLGSAMISMPFGPAFASLEGGTDVFLGDGAPDPTLRGSLSAGIRLSPRAALLAYAQVAKVASPEMANPVPLIVYDPMLNFGLGIGGRFGGGGAAKKPYVVTDNPTDKPIAVAKVAAVSGTVLDDTGVPVVGAQVTVETEKKTGTAVTDAAGKYRVGELPPGPAKISITVAGKKPQELTLTLVDGANPAPQVQLDPELPPGELRGNVRSRAGGRAIANAKISVTPGDFTATSAADGTFAITVPPGKYTMTTTADGFAPQVIEAVVDQEGVTVKFINLDKQK